MAQELFQGIFHPLAISAGSGRLRPGADYDAYVRQLIRQVLLTAPGERINRPDFGAGVRRLVFAPLSLATASLAQTTIYQALTASLDALIRVEEVRAASNRARTARHHRHLSAARPRRAALFERRGHRVMAERDRKALICEQAQPPQVTGIDFVRVVDPEVQTRLEVFFLYRRRGPRPIRYDLLNAPAAGLRPDRRRRGRQHGRPSPRCPGIRCPMRKGGCARSW